VQAQGANQKVARPTDGQQLAHMGPPSAVQPIRILILNQRDCANPEGGGSEIYVETVARALAAGGNDVTIRCASFAGARAHEQVGGVRMLRGGSKLGLFPQALRELRSGALGRPDVVVDVQNGIPFASPLVASVPTLVLVHHVHREQWPVVYGPARSRIGWWIESRVGPRVYRHTHYVVVSESTARELVGLGIERSRIDVIHNGVQTPSPVSVAPTPAPRILVLGRLVPHKQVEHVLTAAAQLRHEVPGLSVSIVGDGWWADEARAEARRLAVTDLVTFHGFVDDPVKHEELAQAWVLALPSLKEGWGLAITEAASHGVPAVAYRSAGGVTESIRDGESGLLVDGEVAEFTAALRRILLNPELRTQLSTGARKRAAELSWQGTADKFAAKLGCMLGRKVAVGAVPTESQLAVAPREHKHHGA
jgi:glycosyltransferase involved in cell wall biosynthesis